TRFLRDFSRRRLFGVAVVSAAVPLVIIALVPNLVIVTFLVVVTGAMAGTACAAGFAIVGHQVDDGTRGRVLAFFAVAPQVLLFLVVAVAPFLSQALTELIRALTGSGNVRVGDVAYPSAGQNLVLLLAALAAVLLGARAYRQLDDRPGMPLRDDLRAAIKGDPIAARPGETGTADLDDAAAGHHGLFIALEGGEGAGKTTQARMLAIWLRDLGYDVVTTREPGATKVGMRLRALLLDTAHAGMSARAEALMYAADRAQHVAEVIGPALTRSAVVITDRYVDSSLAYQGVARGLRAQDVAWLSRWATGGLVPDLTILLDLPPQAGLGRRTRSMDRLEAEPSEFHDRVRAGFLGLARREPERYLVLDATRPAAELTAEIKDRLRDLLPDPVPVVSEADTGSFPAITGDVMPATSQRRS
ncbi:MAG TPA: dTMP kinase, partial [Streptosporangiaceae bacterium]